MTAAMVIDEMLPDTSVDTVQRWARDGQMPSRKLGGKVFFIREEVEDWIIGSANRAA